MSERWRGTLRRPAGWLRSPDLPWLSGIAIACLVVFWPATIGGRFFIIGDAWSESFPLRALAWEAVKRGEFPGGPPRCSPDTHSSLWRSWARYH